MPMMNHLLTVTPLENGVLEPDADNPQNSNGIN